eukprot:TRINITY_DN3237_c0_g1_i11.p1 TRINITY_DN3237_c0_g1~~TRINITY_DN3237_c0_g1_i11.p1  ORF type:complete len:331 (-),score=67.08 TRINITY_DN3237_c0_g1_i11:124-1017(-)
MGILMSNLRFGPESEYTKKTFVRNVRPGIIDIEDEPRVPKVDGAPVSNVLPLKDNPKPSNQITAQQAPIVISDSEEAKNELHPDLASYFVNNEDSPRSSSYDRMYAQNFAYQEEIQVLKDKLQASERRNREKDIVISQLNEEITRQRIMINDLVTNRAAIRPPVTATAMNEEVELPARSFTRQEERKDVGNIRGIPQRRGRLVDPDNMTYEELLALGDQIGHVSKGLSESEIRKIPKQTWNGKTKEKENSCSVCLSQFEAREEILVLPCKHYFHDPCLVPWLRKNRQCPVCKRDVKV